MLFYFRSKLDPDRFVCLEAEENTWVELQVSSLLKQHQKNCMKENCFCMKTQGKKARIIKDWKKESIDLLNELIILRLSENFGFFSGSQKMFWGVLLAKYRLFYTKNILSLIHFLTSLSEIHLIGGANPKFESNQEWTENSQIGSETKITDVFSANISYQISIEALRREAIKACHDRLEALDQITMDKERMFMTPPLKSYVRIKDTSMLFFDKFLDFEDILDHLLKEISNFLVTKNMVVLECLNEGGSRSIRQLFRLFEMLQSHHDRVFFYFSSAIKKLPGHPSPFMVFGAFLSLGMFDIARAKKTFLKASKSFICKFSRILVNNILFTEGKKDLTLVFIEVLFDPSYDLKIRRVSPSFSQVFKRSSRDLRGQPIELLMPEPLSSSHKKVIKNYFESGLENRNSSFVSSMGKEGENYIFPLVKLTRLMINASSQLCFYTMICPVEKWAKKPFCIMDLMGKIIEFSRRFPYTLKLNSTFLRQKPLNVSFLSPVLSKIMAAYRKKANLAAPLSKAIPSLNLIQMNSDSALLRENTNPIWKKGMNRSTQNNLTIMENEGFEKTLYEGRSYSNFTTFEHIDDEEMIGFEVLMQKYSVPGGDEMVIKIPKSLVNKARIAKKKNEKKSEKKRSFLNSIEKDKNFTNPGKFETPSDLDIEKTRKTNVNNTQKNILGKFGMIKAKIVLKRLLEKARKNIRMAHFYEIKAMVQVHFYTSSCGNLQMPCMIIHKVISSKFARSNKEPERVGREESKKAGIQFEDNENPSIKWGAIMETTNKATSPANKKKETEFLDFPMDEDKKEPDSLSRISNYKNYFSFSEIHARQVVRKRSSIESSENQRSNDQNSPTFGRSLVQTPFFYRGNTRKNKEINSLSLSGSKGGIESFAFSSEQSKKNSFFTFSNQEIDFDQNDTVLLKVAKTSPKIMKKSLESGSSNEKDLRSFTNKTLKAVTEKQGSSSLFLNLEEEPEMIDKMVDLPGEIDFKTSLDYNVKKINEISLLDLMYQTLTPENTKGVVCVEKNSLPKKGPVKCNMNPKRGGFPHNVYCQEIIEKSGEKSNSTPISPDISPKSFRAPNLADYIIIDDSNSKSCGTKSLMDSSDLNSPIETVRMPRSILKKGEPQRRFKRKASFNLNPMDYSFYSQANSEANLSHSDKSKQSSKRQELMSNIESFANAELKKKLKKSVWMQSKIAEITQTNPKFIKMLLLSIKILLLILMVTGLLFDFKCYHSVDQIQITSQRTLYFSRSLMHGLSVLLVISSQDVYFSNPLPEVTAQVSENLQIPDVPFYLKYTLLRYHLLSFLNIHQEFLPFNDDQTSFSVMNNYPSNITNEMFIFLSNFHTVSNPLFKLVFSSIEEKDSVPYSEINRTFSLSSKKAISETFSSGNAYDYLERLSQVHEASLRTASLEVGLFGAFCILIALFGFLFVFFRSFSISASHSKIIGFFYKMDVRSLKLTLKASVHLKSFLSGIVFDLFKRESGFLTENDLCFQDFSREEFLQNICDEKSQNHSSKLLKKSPKPNNKGELYDKGPIKREMMKQVLKTKGKKRSSESRPFVLLPFFLLVFGLFSFFVSVLIADWLFALSMLSSTSQILSLHDDFMEKLVDLTQIITEKASCFVFGDCDKEYNEIEFSVTMNRLALQNSQVLDQDFSETISGYFENGFLCKKIDGLCTDSIDSSPSIEELSERISLCTSILKGFSQEEIKEKDDLQLCLLQSLLEAEYIKIYENILSYSIQKALTSM